MKVKGIAAPAPKVRRLSIAAACLAFFMIVSEPAYATSALQVSVTLPMAGANLEAIIPATLEEQIDPNPSLLELDSVKTVDASSMALISVAARKVELARQADGAREVAKEIIAAKYQWSEKEFTCLDQLWIKESHWNYKARNKVTGAHGIAQALPAPRWR